MSCTEIVLVTQYLFDIPICKKKMGKDYSLSCLFDQVITITWVDFVKDWNLVLPISLCPLYSEQGRQKYIFIDFN